MFFSVWMERKENHGEDAPPLTTDQALAVCDGMGGAGAIKCSVNGLERAGAYFASREVSEIFNKFAVEFHSKIFASLDANESMAKYALFLHDRIKEGLNNFVINNAIDFKIKGTFFKLLPTTLAGVVYRENRDNVDAVVFWVGDSRVYGLDSVVGLLQLTKDDLEGNADAMENLMEDARMDNCINLTDEFKVHTNVCKLNKPTVLFCATDGCFGYLPSPIHFEDLFYNAMNNVKGKDYEGLSQRLLEVFKMTASDDCTISAKVFGTVPPRIKEVYNFRRDALKNNYLQGLPSDFFDEVTTLNQNQDHVDEYTEEIKKGFIKYVKATIDKKEDPFADLKVFQKFKKSNAILQQREVAKADYYIQKDKYDALLNDLQSSFYEDYIQSLTTTDKANKDVEYFVGLKKDLSEQHEKIKQASKFFKERFGKVGSSLLSTFDLIYQGSLIPADSEEETKSKIEDFEKIIGFIKGCLEGGNYEQSIKQLEEKIEKQKVVIIKNEDKTKKVSKLLEAFMTETTQAPFASKQTLKLRLEVQKQEGEVSGQKLLLDEFNITKQIELLFDSSKDDIVEYVMNKDDEKLFAKSSKDQLLNYQNLISKSQEIIVDMQKMVAEKYWQTYRFYYESSMPKED